MRQQFILPTCLSRAGIVQRIAHVLMMLPLDTAWSIEIKEHQERRTSPQNRYLWGVCYATLLEHLDGWDADDVHEYMLGECFGWETIEGLGRKRIKPVRRSSRLSKEEFARYVDFVQRKAADFGVFIPDADGSSNESKAA